MLFLAEKQTASLETFKHSAFSENGKTGCKSVLRLKQNLQVVDIKGHAR
jgi:hypothetical protein